MAFFSLNRTFCRMKALLSCYNVFIYTILFFYQCVVAIFPLIIIIVLIVCIIFNAAKPGQDPIITGLMPSYSVGDYIDANCTSDQSNPPTELTWYINERKVSQAPIVFSIQLILLFMVMN